jgi:hypothetical protein
MSDRPQNGPWLERYKRDNAELLERDASFRRWLSEEYVPLAGGWHY